MPDRPAPTPFRQDPTSPLPRVAIYQSSHPNYHCGSMPAVVGMLTTRGRIEKINTKSVIVRAKPEWSTERVATGLSVSLPEARNYGFKLPRGK